jgi:thioesterase domain-containing protein
VESTAQLIQRLRKQQIEIQTQGQNLKLRASPADLTPGLLAEIQQRKPEILAYLQTLTPVHVNEGQPPFFFFHGVTGDVAYTDLFQALGGGCTIYGLQDTSLDASLGDATLWEDSIEAMAGRGILAIRAVQPAGPYRLGGYCFGGVLAYEAAQQLRAAGESVALLVMAECNAPYRYHKRTPLLHPQRLKTFWRMLPRWPEIYAGRGRGWWWKFFGRAWMERRQKRAAETRLKTNDPLLDMVFEYPENASERERQVFRKNFTARWRYEPPKSNQKISLFRSQDLPIKQVLSGPLDPYMGWQAITGDVALYEIPGSHLTSYEPPFVADFAGKLSKLIQSSY